MNEISESSKVFAADLKRWADDQTGPGAPPTAETLIALREGTLDDAEAERLREWIALDPDWAAAWRDLNDFGNWARTDATPSDEIDAAWQAVASRLPDAASETPPIQPRAWWTWSPAWGLAALLVLAAAVWLVVGPSTLEEGRWLRIDLPPEAHRAGNLVTVAAEHDGLIVQAPTSAARGAARIEARTGDTNSVIRTRSLGAGSDPMLRVKRSVLADGGVVVIRLLDADGVEVYRHAFRVQLGS